MSPSTDDEMMQELAAALAEQSVPDHRRDAARAAFTWRTVDAELLALTHDSLEVADATVRSALAVRTVGFESDGLSLELEVDGDLVFGQLLGDQQVEAVELESADHESTTSAVPDPSGVFSFRVPTGPVRLVVRVADAVRRTPWVVLVPPPAQG